MRCVEELEDLPSRTNPRTSHGRPLEEERRKTKAVISRNLPSEGEEWQ